jgi:hypothetical protein
VTELVPLQLLVELLCYVVALFDAVLHILRQLAAAWRLLLERVQYEHSLRELRNVDDPKSVGILVYSELSGATTKPVRLCPDNCVTDQAR